MNGKQKCEILKSIRRDIAKANDISLDIPECTHKGECQGTCPRCESEVKALERQLEARRRRGLKVAVAGISAGVIALTASSCDVIDDFSSFIKGEELLQGDMMMESTEGIMPATDGSEVTVELDGEIAVDVTDLECDVDTEKYELAGDISAADGEDTTGDWQ